jgi:plastocyanin
MDTQKGLGLLTALGAVTAAGFVLFSGSPAITADATFRGVGIVAPGPSFKPDDKDITIEAGTTVVWLPEVGTHHLVADSPADAFTATQDFDKTKPQARTFKEPGLIIKYHCTVHPTTMIGSITVN